MTKKQVNDITLEEAEIKSQSTICGVQPQLHRVENNEEEEEENESQISNISTDGKSKNKVPNFAYHKGPVIANPQVYMLFVGDWNNETNQSRAKRLTQFMTDLLTSPYMNILSQYGCDNTGKVVNTVFIESIDKDMSIGDVKNIIQKSIDEDKIPEPTNPSNIYILYFDDFTGIDDGSHRFCEPTSDSAFEFHNYFKTTSGNTCVFAVIPSLTDTCIKNTCSDDSTCSLHISQTQEQRQTQVTSHELAEMISDPLLNAWTDLSGKGENGDICNGIPGIITVGPNTWTVQQMYSKWHDINTNGPICIIGNPTPIPSLLPQG